MIKIKIICIGTLKEKFFKDAFNEYQKRLSSFCKFELVELDECKCALKVSNYLRKNLPSTSKILLQIKQVAFVL